MRLKAHNRCLKDTNQKYLDTFSEKDVKCQQLKKLNIHAKRELNFKVLVFNKMEENMTNLDVRDKFQHKNLGGLIKFTKKLTDELQAYKKKVTIAEQII